jgi:hypothetical protein
MSILHSHLRECSPVQLMPHTLGLRFNTLDRVYEDDSPVHNATSALDFHAKVGVTRCVNEVDIPVTPCRGHAGRLDGDATLALGG